MKSEEQDELEARGPGRAHCVIRAAFGDDVVDGILSLRAPPASRICRVSQVPGYARSARRALLSLPTSPALLCVLRGGRPMVGPDRY